MIAKSLDDFIRSAEHAHPESINVTLDFSSRRLNLSDKTIMTVTYETVGKEKVVYTEEYNVGKVGPFSIHEPHKEVHDHSNPFEGREIEDFNSFVLEKFSHWKRLYEHIVTAENIANNSLLVFKYVYNVNCGPQNNTLLVGPSEREYVKIVYDSLYGITYPTEEFSVIEKLLRTATNIQKPRSVPDYARSNNMDVFIQPEFDGGQSSSVNIYFVKKQRVEKVTIQTDGYTEGAAKCALGYYERIKGAGVNVNLTNHLLTNYMSSKSMRKMIERNHLVPGAKKKHTDDGPAHLGVDHNGRFGMQYSSLSS